MPQLRQRITRLLANPQAVTLSFKSIKNITIASRSFLYI